MIKESVGGGGQRERTPWQTAHTSQLDLVLMLETGELSATG